jgi:replicative DNA helicase
MASSIRKDYNDSRKTLDLSNMVYGKVPPQSPDLEEAVLAAAMLEREAVELLFSIIQDEEVFYVDAHRKIFKAIKTLSDKGSPVDLLTVTKEN